MRNDSQTAAGFVGYVQIKVGARTISLPVSALPLQSADSVVPPGGFFANTSGEVGILVNSDASPAEVQSQIKRGAMEAWKHLSRDQMN